MKITRIGLDLAKDVFQVHGVDRDGRTVVRRRLRRGECANTRHTRQKTWTGFR